MKIARFEEFLDYLGISVAQVRDDFSFCEMCHLPQHRITLLVTELTAE